MDGCNGVTALVVLCLLTTGAARASEGEGFYVGGGVGQATTSAAGFDDDALSLRVLGGYSIWKYLAVEAAYLHTAQAKDTIGPFELEVETRALIGSVVGRWPMGRFCASAKLGYALYESDQTIRLGATSRSDSHDDHELAAGVAAAVRFGSRFSLRAEYEAVLVDDGYFRHLSLTALYEF